MSYGDRKVPEKNRALFKEPLGRDLTEEEMTVIGKKPKMITVGDVVSLTAFEQGITPDLSIYDGHTERKEMTEFAALVIDKGWKEKVAKNPAGTMTAELFTAIENALKGKEEIIRVIGEEDLAVIPCILLAPEGSKIIYGWPGKGMKLIVTDEQIRKKAQYLMEMTEGLE
ncbi:MAG: GTP-dependent dephospho-CoA kinase family protein [Methanomassiliicoccaceae archaeon]|nr:GTP-dependent dephospho-CoA kinase family protein [Methanomassiliicoccaceae archaeon]MCL2317974.1 GTP-dependent dephospho-CoA kinase family protein [Methanomassiliicoccaceae archaeon]